MSCENCIHILSSHLVKQYLGYTTCNEDCKWDNAGKVCRSKGRFWANSAGSFGMSFILLLPQKLSINTNENYFWRLFRRSCNNNNCPTTRIMKMKNQVTPGMSAVIRFCDNCNNIMRLKQDGDNRPPKYTCEKCEYKHLAVTTLVFIIIMILLGALIFVFYLLAVI